MDAKEAMLVTFSLAGKMAVSPLDIAALGDEVEGEGRRRKDARGEDPEREYGAKAERLYVPFPEKVGKVQERRPSALEPRDADEPKPAHVFRRRLSKKETSG